MEQQIQSGIKGKKLTKTKVKEMLTNYKGELQADNETIKIEGKQEMKLTNLYDEEIDFTK